MLGYLLVDRGAPVPRSSSPSSCCRTRPRVRRGSRGTDHPRHAGRTYALTGPKAVSLGEAPGALSVEYTDVPPAAAADPGGSQAVQLKSPRRHHRHRRPSRPGAGGLLDPARDSARIRAMCTHPREARRGIGQMILSHPEAAAAAEGFSRPELLATIAGQPLHAAPGYRTIERLELHSDGAPVPVVRHRRALLWEVYEPTHPAVRDRHDRRGAVTWGLESDRGVQSGVQLSETEHN